MLALIWIGGCTSTPKPDVVTCPTPHTVHVVNHGRHAGVVVSRSALLDRFPALAASLPDGADIELGWGDARYLREQGAGSGLALRAALWPTASALHVIGLPEPAPEHYLVNEVIPVSLTRGQYRALLDFIAHSFRRGDDGAPQLLEPRRHSGSALYRARGSFHLFSTCNTWLARGLAQAGLPMSSRWVITADDLTSQLHAGGCRERPGNADPN